MAMDELKLKVAQEAFNYVENSQSVTQLSERYRLDS